MTAASDDQDQDQKPPEETEGNDAGDKGGDPTPPEATAPAGRRVHRRRPAPEPEPEPDYGWSRCSSCGHHFPAGSNPTGPQVLKLDADQAVRRTQRQAGLCPNCVEAEAVNAQV